MRARASQLNGCAYCVDMHSRDARTGGETEQRLYALPVWRETRFFTARERAALELTEAATRLTDGPVSDEVFGRAAAEFGEQELAELIWAITVINAWNRLGATARPWALGSTRRPGSPNARAPARRALGRRTAGAGPGRWRMSSRTPVRAGVGWRA